MNGPGRPFIALKPNAVSSVMHGPVASSEQRSTWNQRYFTLQQFSRSFHFGERYLVIAALNFWHCAKVSLQVGSNLSDATDGQGPSTERQQATTRLGV